MDKPNQPHGLPKFPGQKGKLFSRGKFLDGTMKVYYGPDQGPDCWPGKGYPNDTEADPSSIFGGSPTVGQDMPYRNPGEWPAKGSLLRMPQVVYLSSYFSMRNYFTGGAFGIAPDKDVGKFYTAEYERLQGEFEAVKSTLESVRKDRTFATVLNWQNFGGDHDNENWPNLVRDGQLLGAVAPEDQDDYLGTHFLSIHAGNYAADKTFFDTDVPGIILRTTGFGVTDSSNPSGIDLEVSIFRRDDPYIATTTRLSDIQDKFRGYKAAVYSPTPYEGVPYDPENPDTIAAATLGLLAKGEEIFSGKMFQAMASDFGDFGVSYEGDSSAIDSGSLMSMIAEYFRFNPGTGADLH